MASEDQGYLDSDTHTRDKPLQVCDNLQVTPHLTEEAQRRQRKRSRHFCCWRFGRMVGIWGENTGEPKFQCGKKRKLGSTFLLTHVSPYVIENSDQRANGPLRSIPFSPFSPSSTLQYGITAQNTYRTPRSPSPTTHFSPGEPKAHPTGPITVCRSRRTELGVGDVHVQT